MMNEMFRSSGGNEVGRLFDDVTILKGLPVWTLPVARWRPFHLPKRRALKMGTKYVWRMTWWHGITGSQRLPALLPSGPRAFPESSLMWKGR